MPRDAKGNFHLNTQRAHAADRAAGARNATTRDTREPSAPKSETRGESAAMGDHDAMVRDHLEHMHEAHGGRHMHITRHEDGRLASHHVAEDGEVQGPHEHEDAEALKDHVGAVMGDEDQADHDEENRADDDLY